MRLWQIVVATMRGREHDHNARREHDAQCIVHVCFLKFTTYPFAYLHNDNIPNVYCPARCLNDDRAKCAPC